MKSEKQGATASTDRFTPAIPDVVYICSPRFESGCDGDLCMHQWHDAARKAIAEAEGR